MRGPVYQNQQSFYHIHRRRYVWRRRLAVVAVIVTLCGAGYIFHDIQRHKSDASNKPSSPVMKSTVAGPKEFKSTYFSFSDTANWQYVPEGSTPTATSYVLKEGGLPVHRFTVYVNQEPSRNDLATTRVLPIQIRSGNSIFVAGAVSDSCAKLFKPTDPKQLTRVSLDGTSFLCVPDSPQFNVVLGQVGGDYNLKLKRPDGTTANYIIVYTNLAYEHDPAAFERIAKTFQSN